MDYLKLLFILIVIPTIVSAKSSSWSYNDIHDLRGILRDFFDEDLDRAPGALRLAFHDCVGNCDGCLNFANPANGGLQDIWADINALYDGVIPLNGKELSRADLFFVAGTVAVEVTVDYNNQVCEAGTDPECVPMEKPYFDILLGRKDCSSSPDTEDLHDFPQAYFDHTQMMENMRKTFGMNARETVAILGGHTLGAMDRKGSGYNGNWKVKDDQKFMFDNRYFKFLLDAEFEWEIFDAVVDYPEAVDNKAPEDRFQWRGSKRGEVVSNMLDVDVALVRFIDVEDEGGMSTCDFDTCPYSPTKSVVEEYARDPVVWLRDFVCAYRKMTSTGYANDDLLPPTGDESTDGLITCDQ